MLLFLDVVAVYAVFAVTGVADEGTGCSRCACRS